MKPVELYLKAFISYKDEQTVDFRLFSNGFFLINGDIGAGKTTLLDAISFALFGEPSGEGRDITDLHCNLSPLSEDTVVRLTFTQSGRQYVVERKIHFRQKRGTGDYEWDGQKATFREVGSEDIIAVPTDVTRKVKEIIGLDKAQFEKIVMLPQGEFRKFLDADSKVKEEILKKIIDVSVYARYQDILAKSCNKLEKERERNNQAIENHMTSAFEAPDPEYGFGEEMFHYGNPSLLDNLLTLKQADEAAVGVLKNEYDQKVDKVTELSNSKTKAEADNANILDLNKQREHLEELKSISSEMETLKGRYESVSVVVNKVLRVYKDSEALDEIDAKLDKSIADLMTELESITKKLEATGKAAENDVQLSKEAEALIADAAAKRALLVKYDEYQASLGKITNIQTQIGNARKALEDNDIEYDKIVETLNNANLERVAFIDPAGDKAKAEQAYKEARRKGDEFNKLRDKLRAIHNCEKELKEERDNLLSLNADAIAKKQVFDRKYRLLMDGQAASLAKELGKTLKECGEAKCPVCGTHVLPGMESGFAKTDENTVERAEVESARKEFEAADKAYSDLNTVVTSEETALNSRKDVAVKCADEVLGDCTSWDDINKEYLLTKTDALKALLASCEEEVQKKTEALKRSVQLDEILKKQGEAKVRLEGVKTKLSESIAKAEKDLAEENRHAQDLKAGLAYDSKEDAEAKIKETEAAAKAKQKTVEEHTATLNKLNSSYTGTETSLNEKRAQKEQLTSEIARKQNELSEVLSANHFSTSNDALAILEGIDEDHEKWLKDTDAKIKAYEKDLAVTNSHITELEGKTKDITVVNIAKLQDDISKAEAERNECLGKLNEKTSKYNGHVMSYNVVKENKDKLADTEHAWTILKRLSDMAVGVNSDVGKISFERYIMGAFFAELLDRANQKLVTLTGGRYMLNHKTEGDRRNEAAGLDVEVINMMEGFVISKGSLSGGEKFLASLSLALGLSELAQDRLGGQTLDSLFIDEGFGTLDDTSLGLVMNVLNNLTNNNSRLVGIISHVNMTEYEVPHEIRVVKRGSASTIISQR